MATFYKGWPFPLEEDTEQNRQLVMHIFTPKGTTPVWAERAIMAKQKTQDFGAFLTGLSASADPLTSASLEAIKTEMLAQRQEALKSALMTIKSNIDTYVSQLRETRRQEAVLLERIKEQEQKANDIVAGKIDLPELPKRVEIRRTGY